MRAYVWVCACGCIYVWVRACEVYDSLGHFLNFVFTVSSVVVNSSVRKR